MEVEVKIRLPDSAAHQALLSLLSPFYLTTHRQHNTFFDGANSELRSRRAVLRLRFYDAVPPRCVVSLKGKGTLVNGIKRVQEDEDEIDHSVGQKCVTEPSTLPSVESRVVKRAVDEFGVGEGGFACLGGFRNVRTVYEWKGLKLEVDETLYEFGTYYEIECESTEPEKAKELIEGFLKENGVSYSYSVASKFKIYRSGKLPKCKH